jgi:hypothetical protein
MSTPPAQGTIEANAVPVAAHAAIACDTPASINEIAKISEHRVSKINSAPKVADYDQGIHFLSTKDKASETKSSTQANAPMCQRANPTSFFNLTD